LRQRYGYEHGFPLIRSLRASAQRSTSVLSSFVLSLLVVVRSFAGNQKRFWRDRERGLIHRFFARPKFAAAQRLARDTAGSAKRRDLI
jgi:hypothetical protein